MLFGGYDDSKPNKPLTSVEYLNCSRVDNSPSCVEKPNSILNSSSPIEGSNLSILHKNYIYICSPIPEAKCFKAKADQSPLAWSELPAIAKDIILGFNGITAVCNEIWIAGPNGIVVLDTNTEIVKSCSANVKNILYACLVSKNETTYAIGAGDGGKEIWKNTDPTKKTLWQKLGIFDYVYHESSCLLFDNKIYITGGTTYPTFYKTVAILDIRTDQVTRGVDLPISFGYHKMAIINGLVTVIGNGDGTNSYDHIFSLDTKSNSWIKSSRNLTMPRAAFGLIQFPGTLDRTKTVTTTPLTTTSSTNNPTTTATSTTVPVATTAASSTLPVTTTIKSTTTAPTTTTTILDA